MRSLIFTITGLALMMSSCDQPDDADTSTSTKSSRPQAAISIVPAPEVPQAPTTPATIEAAARDQATLASQFHRIADEDLPELMDAVAAHRSPDQRSLLLTTIFEESDLRPDPVRLPLLLEVARSKDASQDVRTTIMGELAAMIGADHGSSWGDWSLALEEHLAAEYGIIRVE